MSDLRNAQRTSYKATYSQISATPAAHAPPPPNVPFRAVEKTAFLHALRFTRQDLEAVQRAQRGLDDSDDARAARDAALDRNRAAIADRTLTSTLNNSALFATIAPSTLVDVADS